MPIVAPKKPPLPTQARRSRGPLGRRGPRPPHSRASGGASSPTSPARDDSAATLPTRTEPSCCESPKIEIIDNAKVCTNCGTQISESNIVAEVTFGETSTGAATVQGGFVGEGSRHAKTLGSAAARRIGGADGKYASREETEANGRAELRQLCPPLRIPSATEDVAFNLWKLAASHNFIQGRRTAEVAGVCLYAACRRDDANTILLMDISEALQVNVFKLGDTYKELCRELYLEVHSHIQPVVEVEPLLMKYCSKLEFGSQTRQVAEDAARIVKRMKRDWMVTGRHPAGLCGACIILAARMNNFRRTIREVVYVVRVSDLTIVTRLSEFKKTRSATLSVKDFREKGLRVKFAHDPPSVGAAAERAKKLADQKKRRDERLNARMSAEVVQDTASRQPSETPIDPELRHSGLDLLANVAAGQLPTPQATQEAGTSANAATDNVRRDADGFAIPAVPNTQSETPTEDTDSTAPKKRGRPKAPVIRLTEEDFAQEHELENAISDVLQDPNCVSAREDTERQKLEARAAQLAEQQREQRAAAEAQRLAALGRTRSTIPDTEIIGDDEFADDPEVQNALLDEEAVRIKETIWLRDNEDWLRAQQAKHLKQAMEEAEGKSGAGGAGRKGAKGGKKRKKGRMGDGSVLTERGTPVESPADAVDRMLEKRGGKTWSRAVDYAALNRVFGGNVGPASPEKEGSEVGTSRSRSQSVVSQSSSRVYTFVEDDVTGADPPAKKRKKSASGSALASGSATPVAREEERRGSQDVPVVVEDNGEEDEDEEDEDEESATGGGDDDHWAPENPDYDYDDDGDYDRARNDVTGDFGTL